MRKSILTIALIGISLILFSSCKSDKKDKVIEEENKKMEVVKTTPIPSVKHSNLIVQGRTLKVLEKTISKNFDTVYVSLLAEGLLNLKNSDTLQRLPEPVANHMFSIRFDKKGNVVSFVYRLEGKNYGVSRDTINGKIKMKAYGSGQYFCDVNNIIGGKGLPVTVYIPNYSRNVMLWDLSKFPKAPDEFLFAKTIEEGLIISNIPNLLEIYKAILAELSAARIAKGVKTK